MNLGAIKKVPTLRFRDSRGKDYPDWCQKRVKEVCDINPKSGNLPEYFIYIDLESVEKGRLLFKNKISRLDAPSRAQRLLQKQDVLIQAVRPYQQNNFHFELDGNFVASTGYTQLRTSDSSKFLYYLVHTKRTLNGILAVCTGTSYPAISSSDLGEIVVSYPSLEEQQKIANFLSSVDTRIEQLEKKKTLLEQYKKGLMQKLFSQEMCFKDEQGEEYSDWEELTLACIGKIIGGGTPDTSRKDYWNGSVVWYTPVEIEEKYSAISLRTISEDGLKNSSAKLLPKGSVLFTSRATIGKVTIVSGECATNQGFQSFVVDSSKFSNEFLYYWLTKNVHEFIRRANGSTYLEITGKEIKSIPYIVPLLQEQQKIASFLSSVDNKIELITQEVDKTREFKKGLLQQMFV